MYTKVSGGLAAGLPAATTLAYTGLEILWFVVLAFTLVAAGFALLRLAPRRER
jgi:hypothetical protein